MRTRIEKGMRFLVHLLKRTWKNNSIKDRSNYSNLKINIQGVNNYIEIGANSILDNITIMIKGDNHTLIIGSNCHIKSASFWFEDESNEIIIGDQTTIESAKFAAVESNMNIKIGKDCMLSENIYFRTGDSHSIINIDTHKRINFGKSITIEDHVWIGANVTILKGVVLEKDSIIGSNALVTKNVPKNTVVGGVPAKELKNNVSWDRKRL